MGHGLSLLLLDVETCWAAPNFRKNLKLSVLEVLQEHNCPQSRVPKAVSPKPPPVVAVAGGGSGPRSALYCQCPARGVGFGISAAPIPALPTRPRAGRGWGRGQPPHLPEKDFSAVEKRELSARCLSEPPEEMAHC